MRYVPSSGVLIDLGCGTGLLAHLVRLTSESPRIIGFDRDEWRLRVASSTMQGLSGIAFHRADIASEGFSVPDAQCIACNNVLYQFDDSQKRALFKKCHRALSPEGTLIINDSRRSGHWKFLFSIAQDALAYKLLHGTMRKTFYFLTEAEWQGLLDETGFHAQRFDVSRGYCYPFILYVCKKK